MRVTASRRARLLLALLVALCAVGSERARSDDDPTISAIEYNREIVRIFDGKCVPCHEPGALSVPLDSYRAVRPWSRAIREEVMERRMPPWPAAPGVRPLANDPALTLRELTVLTAWTDGGTPRGARADLPPPAAAVEWPSGTPDMVLEVPPQALPADGTPQVRRVTLEHAFEADRWLRGFDLMAGEERRALRSAFLVLRTSRGEERWLGGWTPWHAMTRAPDATAWLVRAGSTLVLELHYVAWEEVTTAPGSGLWLALYTDEEPPARILTALRLAASREPGAPVRAELALERDTTLWSFRSRLARAGTAAQGALELRAVRPDGGVEPLLWLPDARPEWPFPYVLRDPISLPAGSRLLLAAWPDAEQTASGPLEVSLDAIAWFPDPIAARPVGTR